MSIVKFRTDDKIRIYSCTFDTDEDDLIRNQNLRDMVSEWTFDLHYDESRMHLTEEEQLKWALEHNSRIYFDKCDHIFDIVLISYDMHYTDFLEYYVRHQWDWSVEYNNLRIEYLIYQDVGGDKNNRRLLSRNLINNPDTCESNTLCNECNGTGRITLLFSTAKCDKCG